ncbi:hypothetical protein ACOMHN_009232 [Nucella lapillus]
MTSYNESFYDRAHCTRFVQSARCYRSNGTLHSSASPEMEDFEECAGSDSVTADRWRDFENDTSENGQ